MSNYDTLVITEGKTQIKFTIQPGIFYNGPLSKDSIYISNMGENINLQDLINKYGNKLQSYENLTLVPVNIAKLKSIAGINSGGKRKTKRRRRNKRSTRRNRQR